MASRLINLIAPNGQYVCAEGGGGYVGPGALVANRTEPLQWEGFVEEDWENGSKSLRTYKGFYVTAELDGRVSADRDSRGAWQRWFPIDGGYRSNHGGFLNLPGGIAGDDIYANATSSSDPTTAFQIIDLTPPVAELPELHVNGRYFVRVDTGARTFLKGATDMMLYKWFLEGHDITPILKQRRDAGCNMVRVLGMVSWFDYTPQKYGQLYYDSVPAFLDLCASFGLYVYWTIFADTKVVMPELNHQLEHFNRMVDRLKQRKNRIGELVNEPYTGTNATANPNAFTRPKGIPFSSGSYNDKYGGQVTPPPYWDFHDFHVPRKDGKRVADQCMVTHPNYVKLGMSIMSGESDKFGGPNQYNAQVYLTDPDLSRQMAVTAQGSANGYVYHTSAGNYSLLWNELELACCPFNMAA